MPYGRYVSEKTPSRQLVNKGSGSYCGKLQSFVSNALRALRFNRSVYSKTIRSVGPFLALVSHS
jgi:hypothetical protein